MQCYLKPSLCRSSSQWVPGVILEVKCGEEGTEHPTTQFPGSKWYFSSEIFHNAHFDRWTWHNLLFCNLVKSAFTNLRLWKSGLRQAWALRTALRYVKLRYILSYVPVCHAAFHWAILSHITLRYVCLSYNNCKISVKQSKSWGFHKQRIFHA